MRSYGVTRLELIPETIHDTSQIPGRFNSTLDGRLAGSLPSCACSRRGRVRCGRSTGWRLVGASPGAGFWFEFFLRVARGGGLVKGLGAARGLERGLGLTGRVVERRGDLLVTRLMGMLATRA